MQQELNEFLAAEAVYEEALNDEKPARNEEMDLELPKETENMIDRFLNHTSHPTVPTTATESLLPPSMNENNGHQLVTSGDNTGNPHHHTTWDCQIISPSRTGDSQLTSI